MNQHENAPLVNDLLDFVMLTRNTLSGSMRHNAKDLTFLQLVVLSILEHHTCLNMTQIAQQLSISNQQLTKLVAFLIEKGYVEKQPDPLNRRANLVTVTESGTHYLKQFKSQCINDLLPMLDDITPEQRTQWQATFQELRSVLMPSIK